MAVLDGVTVSAESDARLLISSGISYPPSMNTLILSNNGMKNLDSSLLLLLSTYPKLTALDVSDNRISELPVEISTLSQLKSLDISRTEVIPCLVLVAKSTG